MSDDRRKDFYERNDNGHIKVRPATDIEWTMAKRFFFGDSRLLLKSRINVITFEMDRGREVTEADVWLLAKAMETVIEHMPEEREGRPSTAYRDMCLAMRVQQIKSDYPRIKHYKHNKASKPKKLGNDDGGSACDAVARECGLKVRIVENAHEKFHKKAKRELELLTKAGVPIPKFNPNN